jgi:hypothetical protein
VSRSHSAQDRVNTDIATQISQILAPATLPGGYANVLGPNEQDQLSNAFGSNITQCELKRRFDPENVFSSTSPAQSLTDGRQPTRSVTNVAQFPEAEIIS